MSSVKAIYIDKREMEIIVSVLNDQILNIEMVDEVDDEKAKKYLRELEELYADLKGELETYD